MDRLAVPVLPRWLRLAGAGGVALGILLASVVDPPSTGAPPVVLGIPQDKWLHALAYAGLASALVYAALAPDGRPTRRMLATALVLAVGYGASIEVVQAFLPARSFDLLDALANALGAVAGVAPWLGLRAR
jgi:VanZ family protein